MARTKLSTYAKHLMQNNELRNANIRELQNTYAHSPDADTFVRCAYGIRENVRAMRIFYDFWSKPDCPEMAGLSMKEKLAIMTRLASELEGAKITYNEFISAHYKA